MVNIFYVTMYKVCFANTADHTVGPSQKQVQIEMLNYFKFLVLQTAFINAKLLHDVKLVLMLVET
jgi:hypothetical protein